MGVKTWPEITSPANPKLKELRKLLRARKKTGAEFAAEGMQLLTRALGHLPVKLIVISPDMRGRLPEDLVTQISSSEVPTYWLAPGLFQKVSRRELASGVAFIAEAKQATLADLPLDRAVVALDRASNPRNIGAIARTVEAANLGGLVLLGNHADPYSYESVRASMGSLMELPVVACQNEELVAWVIRQRRALVGTSGGASQSIWDLELPGNGVILFGNEQEGLPDSLINKCDCLVKIPYNPAVDSLNLAAAAAIICFDYVRQHGLGLQ